MIHATYHDISDIAIGIAIIFPIRCAQAGEWVPADSVEETHPGRWFLFMFSPILGKVCHFVNIYIYYIHALIMYSLYHIMYIWVPILFKCY